MKKSIEKSRFSPNWTNEKEILVEGDGGGGGGDERERESK